MQPGVPHTARTAEHRQDNQQSTNTMDYTAQTEQKLCIQASASQQTDGLCWSQQIKATSCSTQSIAFLHIQVST